MAGGQGNRAAWPSNDDFTFLSLAVTLIGLTFLGWLGWTNYHGAISGVVAAGARWQIGIVHHFTPALDELDRTIAAADPDAVTMPEILNVLNVIGHYLRIPVVAIILVLAVLCFVRAAPPQFTRAFDLYRLILEQTQFFASNAAFARRNLRLVPTQPEILRPSDPPLHAREWVARFARRSNIGSTDAIDIDPLAATRAFVKQLGPVWRGVAHTPDHVRVLYAAFTLHLEQRRSEAHELLGAMALALPPGECDEAAGPAEHYLIPRGVVASADAALQSTAFRERADKIAAGHAYTAPALMSLLTTARRRSGVLAPAQFACLKLVDRSLWYALHSLGFEGDGPGQTTHPNPRVEAAGARDHWAAERLAQRPLIIPSVDRAVTAVRATLDQGDANNRSPEAK